MRSALWRLAAAIGAALYWWAVATLCFTLTAAGPRESLNGDAGLASSVAIWSTFIAGAVGFAFISRAGFRLVGKRHG